MSVGCTCIITYAAKTVKRNLFWQAVIFCGEIKKCFSVLVARNEPQATKSFLIQQFFKNAGEAWASGPHLRSKFNFVVWFSCCNCLRLEICSLSHKNSVCSAVHSCVRQICTCSADTPANDANAVTIKFGLTLSGCPTDNIHSSTNAPAITCSA